MSTLSPALPAPPHHSLPCLPQERWWGGLAADGAQMPLPNALERDLGRAHDGNQAAPLLISNLGRYLWSEQPFSYRLDGGALELNPAAAFTLGQGHGSLRGAYLAASKAHFSPSGQIPHPRLFTHPQYNTWIELLYHQSAAGVLQYAHDLLEHGYPTGVLMIDDTWQQDYGDWTFHPGRFPDPHALVSELHALGFVVMLWVCPFVSPDSLTFRQLEAQGVLLRDASGQTAIRRWWNGHSAVLDFSNPAALSGFNAQLEHLITHYGIDGFKFDAGDPVFYRPDDQFYAPSSPSDQCQRYAQIGLRYPLSEYRASWKMGGQALAQRQRDKAHAWSHPHPLFGGSTGLDSLIPDALAQGLLGYPYLCPDLIVGCEYLALDFSHGSSSLDPELFVRGAQVSALMPMMQFSAAPWRLLSPAEAELCRQMAHLHVEHGERILALAHQAAQTGEPIVRSLEYAYPHQGYAEVRDQFLLGDNLLVAPLLEKGARSRSVILPPGRWQAWHGSEWVGPKVITVDGSLEDLPWFERVHP